MASAFNDKQIASDLEKILSFINTGPAFEDIVYDLKPVKVADLPTKVMIDGLKHFADMACNGIIENLRAFEKKLRKLSLSINERDHHMETALYSVCELQSFIRGCKSDIADWRAARVYEVALAAEIEKLHELEKLYGLVDQKPSASPRIKVIFSEELPPTQPPKGQSPASEE